MLQTRFYLFLGVLLLAGFVGPPALMAAGKGTGLPLPRFVSLRANEVNLRTGPGVQYPVDWVYLRQSLPVEIIAEYGTWRNRGETIFWKRQYRCRDQLVTWMLRCNANVTQ